ncbi:hypothetical protein B398_04645 [Xylella fastidiosa 32]|nr:hypothetical protein B398_04645 [Xylella fastidiosa 32]
MFMRSAPALSVRHYNTEAAAALAQEFQQALEK